jgi:transcriptional repressor NrdR
MSSRIVRVNCPSCQASTKVLESRPAEGGASVRRRRECEGCGRRFTTFERREPSPLYVTKRSGERQRFDRTKLRAALIRAAHKRPVSPADLERLVDRIESAAADAGGELHADRIGELCLTGLRELDVGAYLQFAGTLAEPTTAISGAPAPGSVRLARKDAELPPTAAARGELDV